MHPIVTSNKEFQSFDREFAKIRGAQAKFFERQAKAEATYRARLAEYEADQEACLLRGEAPGYAKPTPPQLEGQASVFQNELMRIETAQRAWLGRRADSITEALLNREAELNAAALALFEQLDEIVEEINEARETAHTVTVASAGGGRAIRGQVATLESTRAAVHAGRSQIVNEAGVISQEGGVASLPMSLDAVSIDLE